MNSKKIIILALVLSVISILSIFNNVQANNKKKIFPAPQNQFSPNESENIKWNSEKNEYYDSEFFKWDSERGDYVPKVSAKYKPKPLIRDFAKETNEWISKNHNSTDKLDRAIISFCEDINKKTIPSSSIALAFQKDYPHYQVFADLGIDGLIEMKNRIENEDTWSFILQRAIAYTTKIDSLYAYADAAEEQVNIKLWVGEFEKVAKEAKFETEKALKNKELLSKCIEKYGIFTLPYLMDSINSGDTDSIEYLPQITERLDKNNNGKLKTYNSSDWKSWFKNNKANMEKIREMLENSN